MPANTGKAGATHRVAWFAGKASSYRECERRRAVLPVGAGLPANTGKAGAIHRVAWFAGKAGSYRVCKRPRAALHRRSRLAGEHRQSRCHPTRRLVRRQSRLLQAVFS